jgi:uncharacterized membrane protein
LAVFLKISLTFKDYNYMLEFFIIPYDRNRYIFRASQLKRIIKVKDKHFKLSMS